MKKYDIFAGISHAVSKKPRAFGVSVLIFLILPVFALASPGGAPKKGLAKNASKEQVLNFKDRAVRGDAEAAYSLYIYYASNSKDGSRSLEWLIIAARLGHEKSIESLEDKQRSKVIPIWIVSILEEGRSHKIK